MGMFNTILVPCPNCGEEIEFQTKSGTRMLERYNISRVPEEEVRGILGRTTECIECGYTIEIEVIQKEHKDFSFLVN